MDYIALKTYIEADPELSVLAAAGSDESIAQALNIRTQPVVGGVDRAHFAMWAGSTGMRSVIQEHADNPSSPLRAASLTVLDFLQGGVAQTIDMSAPENQMMLGAWISIGALTSEQADQLMALATKDEPIFGYVGNMDVARALRG